MHVQTCLVHIEVHFPVADNEFLVLYHANALLLFSVTYLPWSVQQGFDTGQFFTRHQIQTCPAASRDMSKAATPFCVTMEHEIRSVTTANYRRNIRVRRER